MKKLFGKHGITFAVVLLVAGAAVAALSFRGEPKRKLHKGVSQKTSMVRPAELASWIIEGRRDFAIIDLRDPDDFKKGHVREAVNCGHCHDTAAEGRKASQENLFVDLSKKLVLYTETGEETVELPRALTKNPRLYTLQGGYAGWEKEVLAPVTFGGETDLEQVQAKQRQEAVRAFFAGERTSQKAVLPIAPIKRQSAHQPAGAREGC
ncbi:MAG: rhodanese-like domain-containing protein [Archangium sp.]|nr:rhodanese-like domain-containing protein [Archangium sp.]